MTKRGSPGTDDPSGSAPAADRAGSDRRALGAALVATGLSDRRAFSSVYRMTSAKLFGICLRICGERQAAEDVLQEVYLLVWRRAATFEPARASPITWLAAIAHNRALDWRRANRRPPPAPLVREDGRPTNDPADEAPMADVAMIDDEETARLRACLAALDERPRAAIRAAFLDGLTYAQLAERAGVPLPTMKSVVRRGLLRLRDCLADDA